jgi:hypothetical protein
VIEYAGTAAPRRGGTRGLGIALVCSGIAVLPWLLVPAGTLPATVRVSNWSTAWRGLDVLEALGPVTAGFLLLRRNPRRCLTAALLVVDVRVDVTTSVWGTEPVTAVVMALGAELALATLCAVLAVRPLPRE